MLTVDLPEDETERLAAHEVYEDEFTKTIRYVTTEGRRGILTMHRDGDRWIYEDKTL